MIILRRPQTDPYFNMATEEYLLKSKEDDYCMLWQNNPSVIVGKHQNTLAEINFYYLKKNNIPVVRRISGGGTVYHDKGNINFTFIRKGEKGKLVDFRMFIDPLIESLKDLGVDARFEGKNNIRIGNLKISGNSEHVYKNKVLHHGTLLYSSDLNRLGNSIKRNSGSFKDKAVQSIRTEVANISSFLDEKIPVEEFKEKLLERIALRMETTQDAILSKSDIEAIEELVKTKYKTWQWNFGYSPEYIFTNSSLYQNNRIDITMNVKNGKIVQAFFEFSGKDVKFDHFIQEILSGRYHAYPEIEKILEKYRDELNNWHLKPDIMLQLLF